MEWGVTDKELVQSWLAFKELHRQGVVVANIPNSHSAPAHGWKNWWGVCTDKYFLERILGSPEDFRLGHDTFGFDVIISGSCVNPGDLPQILAKHSGKTDIETLFDPSEVAKEVQRLALARRNQK